MCYSFFLCLTWFCKIQFSSWIFVSVLFLVTDQPKSVCGYFRQQRYIYIYILEVFMSQFDLYIYFWRFSFRVVSVRFVRRQGFSFTTVCEPFAWSIFASKLIVFLSHRSMRTGLSLPLLFRSGLTADRWLCLPLSSVFSSFHRRF
jgi:hypothetical protein